ncbi:hypothetical protein GCM10023068_00850 [Leifsonia shinshuensis]
MIAACRGQSFALTGTISWTMPALSIAALVLSLVADPDSTYKVTFAVTAHSSLISTHLPFGALAETAPTVNEQETVKYRSERSDASISVKSSALAGGAR